jgi:hypothetical protein
MSPEALANAIGKGDANASGMEGEVKPWRRCRLVGNAGPCSGNVKPEPPKV